MGGGVGGAVLLGYVVKRVKGRLYVYEQYREGGRVVTKYVGPLERLVEYYKGCNKGLVGPGGFEPPTSRLSAGPTYQAEAGDALRENASRGSPGNQLTTHGVKRLPGVGQSAAGALDNSPCLEITRGLLAGFDRWLAEEQGTGEKTRRDYMRYLSRLEGLTLCGKQDVSKAFERMGLNKTSYEAFSRLLTYLEKKTSHEELALSLRRGLPRKPRGREDTYVPSDSEVASMLECVEGLGGAYRLYALVLAYSGLRGSEARRILEAGSSLRVVGLPYGAVRLHLDMVRGSKRAYVAYLPAWLWREIMALQGRLPHQDTLEDKLRECGLATKYLRKWWRQKAKELGVDSETIEAFQGRPSTIGGRHYTDWLPILDREYERIMRYITAKLGLEG